MGAISNLFGYLLNFLYNIFNNYGIAIILFSLILRIILIPITISQQKSMKKNSKIQIQTQEIQKKYKNNPEKMNQEIMDLYKREKTNPFGGCLSAIIQIVIILSVFWLVSKPLTYMKKVDPEIINNYTQQIKEENQNNNNSYTEIQIINKKAAEDDRVNINMEFLGLDLSKVPTQSSNDFRVYIIPALYVISSFISIKITTKSQTNNNNNNNDEKSSEIEAMQSMSKSMTYFMPIMSVSIAIIAPLGLALYWFISNILMILERLIIDKVINSKEEQNDA